jgi:hypothetical protein
MATQPVESSGGTIIRGADGSLYLLRDEVLEACRIPDDQAKEIDDLLTKESEVEGFNMQAGGLEPVGHIRGYMGNQAPVTSRSTIMCSTFPFKCKPPTTQTR